MKATRVPHTGRSSHRKGPSVIWRPQSLAKPSGPRSIKGTAHCHPSTHSGPSFLPTSSATRSNALAASIPKTWSSSSSSSLMYKFNFHGFVPPSTSTPRNSPLLSQFRFASETDNWKERYVAKRAEASASTPGRKLSNPFRKAEFIPKEHHTRTEFGEDALYLRYKKFTAEYEKHQMLKAQQEARLKQKQQQEGGEQVDEEGNIAPQYQRPGYPLFQQTTVQAQQTTSQQAASQQTTSQQTQVKAQQQTQQTTAQEIRPQRTQVPPGRTPTRPEDRFIKTTQRTVPPKPERPKKIEDDEYIRVTHRMAPELGDSEIYPAQPSGRKDMKFVPILPPDYLYNEPPPAPKKPSILDRISGRFAYLDRLWIEPDPEGAVAEDHISKYVPEIRTLDLMFTELWQAVKDKNEETTYRLLYDIGYIPHTQRPYCAVIKKFIGLLWSMALDHDNKQVRLHSFYLAHSFTFWATREFGLENYSGWRMIYDYLLRSPDIEAIRFASITNCAMDEQSEHYMSWYNLIPKHFEYHYTSDDAKQIVDWWDDKYGFPAEFAGWYRSANPEFPDLWNQVVAHMLREITYPGLVGELLNVVTPLPV